MTPQNIDRFIMGLLQQVAPGLPKVVPTYGDLIGFPLWILFLTIAMVIFKKIKNKPIIW